MRSLPTIVVLALFGPAAWAQSSSGYSLSNWAFNQGGHPLQGVSAASASFRLRSATIGESVVAIGVVSPSYALNAGSGAYFIPPGEVQGLRFHTDHTTLEWNAAPAAVAYDLYRDLLSTLAGRGYGHCLQGQISVLTLSDPGVPPTSNGYFYLVTAEDRFGNEGTKGWDSEGSRRANAAPCP